MPTEEDVWRMDFTVEILSTRVDERSHHIFEYRMELDPQGYEDREIDGKTVVYDKYDYVYFGERKVLFENLMESMKNDPNIYGGLPKIID